MRSAIVAAFLSALLIGCTNLGRDNVAFITRTNVAIDFDTLPLTTAIGYKRDELVLAPVDDEARVLPVLTTVGAREGIFQFAANHSFATGDAALLMSQYLLESSQLKPDVHIGLDSLKCAITTGLPGNQIGDKRERYAFTTNTSLGLEVSWSAEQLPTAISLGYKRKEFAAVPIKKTNADDTARLASLLATAHGNSAVSGPRETGVVIGQTYATGFAATLMATHPEVRRAVGPSIVPNFLQAVEEETQSIDRMEAESKRLNEQAELVDSIKTRFEGGDEATKEKILERAIELGIVEQGTTIGNLKNRLTLAIDSSDAAVSERLLKLDDLR